MATYSTYYQYLEQPPLLSTSNVFQHGQYDYQRPKTPTSMINHSGFSPGPLSTPPMSRNTSQPPEQLPDQPPDPMTWDDVPGSTSESPTSVKTPDDEAFEFDMLDAPEEMRDLYEASNAAMMTTHVSNQALPALDTTMLLSDQDLQDALLDSQQRYQYHATFTAQSQPMQPMVAPQSYNQTFSQNYTQQLPSYGPWTSQGPPRNPTAPQSGMAVFDPASDHMIYSNIGNVDDWMNNTDPNYYVSPNDLVAPNHENIFFPAMQNHVHVYPQPHMQHHNHTPVQVRLTVASPPPDSRGFINYDSTSPLFTENYITESQCSPPSSGASSYGQTIHSPYQPPLSPQASVPSPGGSEGMLSSYQRSDGGLQVEAYPGEHLEHHPLLSPIHLQHANRTIPGITIDPSPEPEPQRRHSTNNRRTGNRPGGRAPGTHLDTRVAKAAHDMRKITACWHCVLQRDKCGPGNVCERCMKRSQRPNADCGLGCSRIKLVELTGFFLPTLVTRMHEDLHLTHFVSQHIRQWHNTEITLLMTCGQTTMPRIPVKVYEFLPKGKELLVQLQYKTDPNTYKRIIVRKTSPALGMVHINHNEEKKYDKYITDIVDNHIDAFGDLCWKEDDNDFQEKLFRLMTRVKPKSDDETKLFREVYRLIVCTFIMSHTLTIAEENKHSALSRMHSYEPDAYVEDFTSPRMTNRQLKYFFSRLQRSIMTTILNKLQQVYKSSKGCDKWLAAFIVVLGMSMAHEDQQKIIHQTMTTKATTEHLDIRDLQADADDACREIDARMGFIAHIFRLKYNRKCNPLRDSDHDWEREVGFGDAGSVTFVRQVAQLVKENIDYLQGRQNVSISSENQTKYTSRLVGQFLLSFWLPT